MAKFTELLSSIDSVFASSEWQGLSIPAYPANLWPATVPDEFIIYEIIPSGMPVTEYSDPNYKGGVIIIQLYVKANSGPARVYEVADELATLFQRDLIRDTQLYDGTLAIKGIDKDDTSLFRADYSLQFNSF
jgi:hypothetical protein